MTKPLSVTLKIEAHHGTQVFKTTLADSYPSETMTAVFSVLRSFEHMLSTLYPAEHQESKEGW